MFNAVLVQSVQEAETFTAALNGAGDTPSHNPLLLQCLEVARQFLADANAVARLVDKASLFGPLGTNRSGDRW